jgi:hypothetical protein
MYLELATFGIQKRIIFTIINYLQIPTGNPTEEYVKLVSCSI